MRPNGRAGPKPRAGGQAGRTEASLAPGRAAPYAPGMRNVWTSIVVAALTVFVGACASSSPRLKTYLGDEADFSRYRTIAFGGPGQIPKGYSRGELPPRLVEIARDVFSSTMADKGYEIVSDLESADIVLVGGVGTKEKTIQNPSPVRDTGFFSVAMPEMSVATGAVVLDVFERATGEPVWGGSLSAVMSDEPVSDEVFRRELQRLLDELPPSAAAPGSTSGS